jgi:hypothetical protein
MKFIVKYTIQDYIEAQKLHLRNSKNGWLVRWFFPTLGVGILVSLVALFIAEIPVTTFQVIYFGILGIFFISLPIATVQLSTRYLFKKSKFLHTPSEFEITEEEVKMTSELNSGVVKWPLFIKAAHNDIVLILMSTPRTMMMIPRRCVSSDQDWNELIRLANEKVKKV